MKLASFDLETAAVVPETERDWSRREDLGISCAAVAADDLEEVQVWEGRPRLTKESSVELVHRLMELRDQGHTLITWNGCGFDYRVLAEESALVQECGELALHNVDLMVMVTFKQGHFLGLKVALEGAGLAGKLQTVQLSNGSMVKDMDGSKVPALWAAGEYEAVLEYLRNDARQLLELAHTVERRGYIRWTSRTGNPQEVRFPKLLTVSECFDIPEPDTSWMSDPPRREQFVDWIE